MLGSRCSVGLKDKLLLVGNFCRVCTHAGTVVMPELVACGYKL